MLGDSTAFRLQEGAAAWPPCAQLAEQMGFAAAAMAVARLREKPVPTFTPHMLGVLCDLGGLNAAGLVYALHVHGLAGALAKRMAVHLHLWRTMGLPGLVRHLRETIRQGLAQRAVS